MREFDSVELGIMWDRLRVRVSHGSDVCGLVR